MKYFKFIIVVLVFASSCKPDNDNANSTASKAGNPAIDQLRAMIQNDPDNAELLFERAKLYYENKAYDEAIDDILQAQKVDSIKAEYYHLLADVYLDYYKSHAALETMEKVVSIHPRRIQSLLKLAEFEYILKRYDESIRSLNNVLAVDRLEPEAFFMLGMNFRAKGEKERAKNAFQTAVENNPDLIDAWLMLGAMYENEDDPKALTFYDNALIVAPESVEALHAKAFYHQNHGQIETAIEIYKKINVIDPQYSDAYLNTGLLYLELDSLALAHEHFNIMVKIDLGNPIGYFYRAYTFERVGDFENAKKDYEQALKLSPKFEEAKKALELLQVEKIQ